MSPACASVVWLTVPPMTAARPLIVRFGALGDMVMMTPLLRVLAERHGGPCDVLGSGPWTAAIFNGLPWVADVHVLSGRRTPYYFSAEQRRVVQTLRQRGRSPLWLLEDMPKAWRLMQRAGFSSTDAVRMIDDPRATDEHTVCHWLRLAQRTPADWPLPAADPAALQENCELRVLDDERADCAQWLQERGLADAPLVLIQAGSKKTMKRGRADRRSNLKYWPLERWAAVIDGVCEARPHARVLLCGAPAEQELALALRAATQYQHAVHAVADQLPLRRLLALMQRAHSCISVDTGPAHVAAACNCPLVVLFGQTNARLYHPVSSESAVSIVSQTPMAEVAAGSPAWAAANSMDGISVAQVLQAWQQLDTRDV